MAIYEAKIDDGPITSQAELYYSQPPLLEGLWDVETIAAEIQPVDPSLRDTSFGEFYANHLPDAIDSIAFLYLPRDDEPFSHSKGIRKDFDDAVVGIDRPLSYPFTAALIANTIEEDFEYIVGDSSQPIKLVTFKKEEPLRRDIRAETLQYWANLHRGGIVEFGPPIEHDSTTRYFREIGVGNPDAIIAFMLRIYWVKILNRQRA